MAEPSTKVFPVFEGRKNFLERPPLLIPDTWLEIDHRSYQQVVNRLRRYIEHVKGHSDAIYPRLVSQLTVEGVKGSHVLFPVVIL